MRADVPEGHVNADCLEMWETRCAHEEPRDLLSIYPITKKIAARERDCKIQLLEIDEKRPREDTADLVNIGSMVYTGG